ncbi:response regulator [Paenibacillus sp. UNC499MF]|uniref:response regulator transcription factor n=1 Tax=Paenibacillus sp. UNC499MF TaxID=1502751 RepID=UPI00089FE945|nr:response regulator [Paenibacillus sp. UNC499MF]SEF69770.1 two-component system, response regulator YesN [Paenibacillus sp. UNC499MF]
MKRILVVDDEPLIRQGLVAMLGQLPYDFEWVRTAGNGQEALDRMNESLPQLLLTDIRMPKMDGLELCRQVYDKYPLVQKVIISGYGDFEYAQNCISYGVKEYILKPFTTAKIGDLLNRLISQGNPALSISKYEDLIGDIAESVWSMRIEEMETVFEQLKTYCLTASRTDYDFVQLLKDCLPMLKKRLALKGFYPAVGEIPDSGDHLRYFEMLHVSILKIIDELALQRGGQDLMLKAKDYMDAHITKELSLEDTADYLGITPQYLSFLFKKVHKETFVQYRILKRIELAKKLLEIPRYRTNDIAYEVGYENYPHFSRMFKKVTGVSPLEYRQQLGIK